MRVPPTGALPAGAPHKNVGQTKDRLNRNVGQVWVELDIGSDAPINGSVFDLHPKIGAHSLKLLKTLQRSC